MYSKSSKQYNKIILFRFAFTILLVYILQIATRNPYGHEEAYKDKYKKVNR